MPCRFHPFSFAILASTCIFLCVAVGVLVTPIRSIASGNDFDTAIDAAAGKTVYFNAWGGDDKINAYIEWASAEVSERFDITLVHVKLGDTGAAVSRILAEKAAGRDTNGSVDLLWVNGANFAAMKKHSLLQPAPWVEDLP